MGPTGRTSATSLSRGDTVWVHPKGWLAALSEMRSAPAVARCTPVTVTALSRRKVEGYTMVEVWTSDGNHRVIPPQTMLATGRQGGIA